MQIWVDADGCPQPIKEIVFRAAQRVGVATTLVANRRLKVPSSPHIRVLQVAGGPDVADDTIVEHMAPGDLVVTADIPLAARVVEKGGLALDPRGDLYSEENIGERLATRNLLQELRSEGMVLGGPPPLSKGARQAFANQLDRILARPRQE